MACIKSYVCSSVGKKFLVGITGTLASLFVLTHMVGNLLILCGAEAYNKYSHALVSNPLLPLAEIGLIVIFGVHIGFALCIAWDNRKARNGRYHSSASQKAASFASRTMILTGLLTLVFLIIHLKTFRFGVVYDVEYSGVKMRDLHRLIVEEFQSLPYVGFYLFSLVVLGLHLSHGVSAVFQSLGITTSLNPTLRRIAYAFAVVVVLGFMSQPLYVLWQGGH